MSKTLPRLLLFSLLLSSALFAQTTYTTTADSCSGKASQYCSLPVASSPDNGITNIVIDSRGSYPNAQMYIGGWGLVDPLPGTLAGFVANPDGTHHDYYGAGSFTSTDGLVSGDFQFHAYYVSICSGRGCGWTLGWHYRILQGSIVKGP